MLIVDKTMGKGRLVTWSLILSIIISCIGGGILLGSTYYVTGSIPKGFAIALSGDSDVAVENYTRSDIFNVQRSDVWLQIFSSDNENINNMHLQFDISVNPTHSENQNFTLKVILPWEVRRITNERGDWFFKNYGENGSILMNSFTIEPGIIAHLSWVTLSLEKSVPIKTGVGRYTILIPVSQNNPLIEKIGYNRTGFFGSGNWRSSFSININLPLGFIFESAFNPEPNKISAYENFMSTEFDFDSFPQNTIVASYYSPNEVANAQIWSSVGSLIMGIGLANVATFFYNQIENRQKSRESLRISNK